VVFVKYRAEISTKEQLSEALEIQDFEYIYAPMEFLGADTPEKQRIIAIPPVFLGGNEQKIAEQLRNLKQAGFESALAHTLGHIELIKSAGLYAHGGFRLNITNSLALKKYTELGLKDAVSSVEAIVSGTGIIACGKIPLMLLRRCPVRDNEPCGKSGCNSLTDRHGNKMQTLCRFGEVEILNPYPIVLSDKKITADFAVLKFSPGENISKILDMYRRALPASEKFTRGLYFKKVK